MIRIEYDQAYAIVNDVMEKMAFMFCEPSHKDQLVTEDEDLISAMIRFSGSDSGAFSLTVPQGCAIEIACNMLGAEPDDEGIEAKSSDALKEVLNVICGQILTACAGEEAVFDLSMPEIKGIDSAEWSAIRERDGSMAFLVDDSPFLLNLEFHQGRDSI